MKWLEQRLDIGPLELAYKKWGQPSEKPAVVMFHGWLDNANSFDAVLAYLPDDREYFVFDLPGHGHSDHKPESQLYHFLDSVADIKRTLDALTAQTLVAQAPWLVGHSLGAALSSVFVSIYPESVKGVCFIEALGPISNNSQQAAKQLKESIDKQVAPKSDMVTYSDLDRMIKARQKGIGGLSYEASEVLIKRAITEVEGGYQWRSDARLRIPSPMRLSENQCQSFLTQIKLPAKIILAEDSLIPEDAIAHRLSYFENATIVRLPGGHHLHMEESAEQVALELLSFINN